MPNLNLSTPSYSDLDEVVAKLGITSAPQSPRLSEPVLSNPDLSELLQEISNEKIQTEMPSIRKRSFGLSSPKYHTVKSYPKLSDIFFQSRDLDAEMEENSEKVPVFYKSVSLPNGSSRGESCSASESEYEENEEDIVVNETGTIRINKKSKPSIYYSEEDSDSNSSTSTSSTGSTPTSSRFRSLSSPSLSPLSKRLLKSPSLSRFSPLSHRSKEKKEDKERESPRKESPRKEKREEKENPRKLFFQKSSSETSTASTSLPNLLLNPTSTQSSSPQQIQGRNRSNSAAPILFKKLKSSNSFEMPHVRPDGASEMFAISDMRDSLKKSRNFLLGRDKKAERVLSMRVMNLPIDASEDEKKIEMCILKLLDPVEGLKLKKRKGEESFSGSKMVTWLRSFLHLSSEEAVQFAQTSLMNRGVFTSISSKHQSFHDKSDVYYKFKFHDHKSLIMNESKFHLESVKDPVGLSKELLGEAIKLLEETRSLDEKFNFNNVRNSKEYIGFCLHVTHLQTVNLTWMKPEERSAFYINVFNLLSLHARFALGEPKNNLERKELLNRKYLLAMSEFSMEDLKTCLRCLPDAKAPSGLNQPILSMFLFNGTERSLPIRVIDPSHFTMEKVKEVVGSFLYKNSSLSSAKGELFLPKIFREIGPDFGPNKKEVIRAIGDLMDSSYLKTYGGQVDVRYYEHTYEKIQYLP